MRRKNSSANPLGPPPADRASRVAMIVRDCMRRSDAGALIDFDEICRRHGDLMPELGDRLRTLQRVLSAEHLAKARPSAANSSDPQDITPAELSWLEAGIAGYEIRRRLGRGGQGSVYLAMQKSTKRQVAIKVLTDGPIAHEGELRRFDREVNLLVHLNHPNIVTVHDKGVVNGHPYFVMEYVDGMVITDYAMVHNLSATERVRLFAEVVKIVRDAHQRGVIHRDLKPSNILIDENGTPKVLDFGLGKALDELGQATHATTVSMIGQVMGTLPYISPEQAEGAEDIDTRTDVYSLGVVLFELLTGQLPIDTSGKRLAAYNRILMDRPRRLRECLNGSDWDGFCSPGEIGDDLEAIVAMALAKERAERYQGADAMAQDLERYLSGDAIQARSNQGYYQLRMALRRHRRVVAVAAAFALVVTASLVTVAYFWIQARTERNNAQTAAQFAQQTLYQVVSEVDEIITPVAGGVEARNRVLSQLAPNLDHLSGMAGPDSMTDELFALTHEKRGDVALAEGRRADAQAHFELVRDRITLALSGGAANKALLAQLVRAHSKLAQVAEDPDQHHLQAVRLARELAAEESTRADNVLGDERPGAHTLHQTLVSYGRHLAIVGRHKDAAKRFEEVLNHHQNGQEVDASDTSSLLTTALACEWYGETLRVLGDGQRALEYLSESVRLLQQLASRRPFDVRVRSELVFAFEKLADYFKSDGRYQEALDVLHQAEAECVTLTAMEPTVAAWRRHLVTARYRLGQCYDTMEDLEQAAHWADRAFAAVQFDDALDARRTPYTSGSPQSPSNVQDDGAASQEFREELGFCHLLRGRVQFGLKQYAAAEKDFVACLTIRQDLALHNPDNDRWRESLAVVFNYLASCYRQQDRHDKAFEAYQAALNIRLALLVRAPDVTERAIAVASSYMKMAVWHLDQRTPEHDLAAIPNLDRAEAMLVELRESGQMEGRAGELKLWLDSIDDNRQLITRRASKREAASALRGDASSSAPTTTVAGAD